MRACQHDLVDMVKVADTGGNDLSLEAVLLKNLDHISNKLHAVFADVVQTADEGADVSSTGH